MRNNEEETRKNVVPVVLEKYFYQLADSVVNNGWLGPGAARVNPCVLNDCFED